MPSSERSIGLPLARLLTVTRRKKLEYKQAAERGHVPVGCHPRSRRAQRLDRLEKGRKLGGNRAQRDRRVVVEEENGAVGAARQVSASTIRRSSLDIRRRLRTLCR